MIGLLKYWKLILGALLIVLLVSLWLLYRGQVAEVGRLETLNGELTRSLKQAELDKDRLEATVEGNARISEKDEVDRKKLSDQVIQLNSSIAKLTKEKNVLKKQVGGNANTCEDGSDLELSDDLSRMLNDARDKANNPSSTSSKPNN